MGVYSIFYVHDEILTRGYGIYSKGGGQISGQKNRHFQLMLNFHKWSLGNLTTSHSALKLWAPWNHAQRSQGSCPIQSLLPILGAL